MLTNMAEVNSFFLKTTLRIPVESNLNWIRLLIVIISAAPSIREIYQYVTDPRCNRFGSQAWILVAILVVEVALIVKTGADVLPIENWREYFPLGVRVVWGVYTVLYFSFVVFYFRRPHAKTVEAMD